MRKTFRIKLKQSVIENVGIVEKPRNKGLINKTINNKLNSIKIYKKVFSMNSLRFEVREDIIEES